MPRPQNIKPQSILVLIVIIGCAWSILTTPRVAIAAAATPTDTPIPTEPLYTSTPNLDGSVTHQVKYGQTLISIAEAYGMTINDLLNLNNLTLDSSIYVGDQLIIIPAVTPTITNTPTVTSTATTRPTSTRHPSVATPTRAPISTETAVPTATPEPGFSLSTFNPTRKQLGISLIVFCSLGLIAVGYLSLRYK